MSHSCVSLCLEPSGPAESSQVLAGFFSSAYETSSNPAHASAATMRHPDAPSHLPRMPHSRPLGLHPGGSRSTRLMRLPGPRPDDQTNRPGRRASLRRGFDVFAGRHPQPAFGRPSHPPKNRRYFVRELSLIRGRTDSSSTSSTTPIPSFSGSSPNRSTHLRSILAPRQSVPPRVWTSRGRGLSPQQNCRPRSRTFRLQYLKLALP